MDENNIHNEDNGQNNIKEGYTVTPEGGFYNGNQNFVPSHQNTVIPPIMNAAPARSVYTPPRTVKQKSGVNIFVVIIACILAAFIGASGGVAAMMYMSNDEDTPIQINRGPSQNSSVTINVDETAASVVEAVAEKAGSSVVGIRTTVSVEDYFYGTSTTPGEGSGVIYTTDGYIITNYHVIKGVVEATSDARIDVYLDDSSEESYEATVVGYSISYDLAVIKINVEGLPAVEIADSDELKIGQFVVAIGCPGGLDFMGSVTYGVISGLNRVVSSDADVKLIQTDAAINPGNSGGAMLNTSGQLIGINSSKIVSTEYEGMGFAIPVNTVVEKCDKIISKQNKPEPYIGINISKRYTADILKYYGYPVGAVVSGVEEGSPAQKAGIERGDIITEFNGKEISSVALLSEYVSECEPNDKVTVKFYRSGRYYSTKITISSNNSN